MKRFLSIVVAIVATVMNSNAQNLTATLEQNNSITTYYGENAFKDAYEAASSGATITLSAGYFYTVEKISKNITIIGCGGLGYSSLGKYTEINSNYNSNTKISSHFTIEANNVRLEGLYLGSHVYIGSSYNSNSSISNLKISNCHIGTLYGISKYRNAVIDQCYISSIYNTKLSENLCIKNSYIVEFSGSQAESTNPAYITNCIIPHWYYNYYDGTTFNRYPPTATYKNCVLGYSNYHYNNSGSNYYMGFYISNVSNWSNHEYYNNVFYLYPYKYTRENNSNSFSEKTVTASDSLKRITISPPSGNNSCIAKNNIGVSYNNLFNTSKSWFDSAYVKVDAKGDDGKPVGLYGGTGFSPYPNIPRIVDSQIDSNTDEAGKLNVKIKVEVNK